MFFNLELAEKWIKEKGVSGLLTAYPVNTGVYDWAIQKDFFRPKYPSQKSPEFIQGFNSAYLEHYHYKNGKQA